MKALSILATVFFFTSAIPSFAYPSNDQIWRWEQKNLKISDIKFDPEFLIVSVPVEDTQGSKFEFVIQCGNNPNFYYKQLALQSKAESMGADKELVTKLCTEAFEVRDVYIRQLLSHETCKRINWQYGISSIPVSLYGNIARKKDHNRNGFACDL